ncbi:MAG: SUMF1/EgtB/PvdO family nonheme iron enzyme [Bacteroidota bacterium]
MKMIFSRYVLVMLGAGVLLSGCAPKQQSPTTGMRYNDKYNGGFQVFRKTHPAPGPGLIAIEGGTFVLGGSAGEDVTYEYNNVRKRKSISTFYMDETEVSNNDWREYLYWLQTTFPEDRELYYNAIPDTLVWRRPLSYNEPYVDNYLRGSAFQDYPVVGVSWDQVQDYCDWRTQRMNENILRSQGQLVDWKTRARANNPNANAANGTGAPTTAAAPAAGAVDPAKQPFNTEIYLNGQYKGPGIDGKRMPNDLNPLSKDTSATSKGKVKRPVRKEDGILRAGYRLPTEAEWEYAALGLIGNTQFENITEGKVYPWNGMGVRSPKSKTRGLILANFKRGGGDNAGVGGYLNDKADITAPVRMYEPNDFGLYNMAGNVNEWTNDTYRQTSFDETDDFNPFRGNQFTNKAYADAVKGVYAKDKYGRPIKVAAKGARKQTWAEMVAEQQANAANTAGTPPANAANKAPAAKNPIAGKAYTPDVRGFNDTVNTTLYGVTTLVSDKSKVYKGGSWNDRAYWLNPAARRYLDEDDASAEIGFRCAMNYDGPPEINPSGKPEFSIKKQKDFNPKKK